MGRRAALVLAAACALAPAAGGSQTADNELARIKGDVGYAAGPQAKPQTLLGSIVLPKDAFAITQPHAAARIVFSDSSEIRIGDRTRLRIGDLAPGSSERTILLESGAVRFDIIHPAGPHATYTFKTPTSQVAVRGTIGYAVTGPGGDQIYCVACQPDDVEVRAGGRTLTILSGQSVNVVTRDGRVGDATVVRNETINNPAIDQFLGGVSPFGKRSEDGFDLTLSRSGT